MDEDWEERDRKVATPPKAWVGAGSADFKLFEVCGFSSARLRAGGAVWRVCNHGKRSIVRTVPIGPRAAVGQWPCGVLSGASPL